MDPPFTSRSKTGINSFHPRDHPCCDPNQQDWRRSPNRPPSASGFTSWRFQFRKENMGKKEVVSSKERIEIHQLEGIYVKWSWKWIAISWYNTVCFNQKMSNITTSSAHFQLRWSFSAEGFLTQPFKTGETPAVSTTRCAYLVKIIYKDI